VRGKKILAPIEDRSGLPPGQRSIFAHGLDHLLDGRVGRPRVATGAHKRCVRRRHPYEEVFVMQEGSATLTAADEKIEAKDGQIVVVPAGVAHKFVNSGTGRLRQIDIHASERFITEWLE
jgi:mannose-6-phosphate isomerase-like protein (cupin superfamily)